MKNRILILLAALLCLLCALTLVACDEGDTPEGETPLEHTHEWGEWVETTAATCVTKGIEVRICACGANEMRYVDEDLETHIPANVWSNDSADHWHSCTRDGCDAKVDKATHTFGEWQQTLAPTCVSVGSHYKVCSVCQYTVTEDIPIDPNAHTPVTAWSSDATHHWHECACTGCGADLSKTTHTFGEWQQTLAPTCVSVGSHYKVCSVCQYSVTEDIPIDPNAHTPVTAWSSDATYHWHECTRTGCGADLSKTTHSFGDWVQTKAPTCVSVGSHYKVCSVCQYTVTEDIPIDVNAHTPTRSLKCEKCEARVPYFREGNYIYFGEYPQTIKAEGVTVTETQDARGYFLGSDGAYYAKVTAEPYKSGYVFSDGSAVTGGTVYYFKVDPIRWRILSEDDGIALILCESIIENRAYDNDNNDYAESNIRAWLNAQFYNTAFAALEQALILTTTVDNSVSSTGYTYNSNACEDTNDKVFLLSYVDVINSAYGFPDYTGQAECREKITSDYSRATGVTMHTSINSGFWWLRSPYYNNLKWVRGVSNYGQIADGYTIGSSDIGVVPALRIRL